MTSHASCFSLNSDFHLEIQRLSDSRDGSSWNWTSHCCVECWQSDERMIS